LTIIKSLFFTEPLKIGRLSILHSLTRIWWSFWCN